MNPATVTFNVREQKYFAKEIKVAVYQDAQVPFGPLNYEYVVIGQRD
jgi:hypothetical protein